jgi:hypothetical protein
MTVSNTKACVSHKKHMFMSTIIDHKLFQYFNTTPNLMIIYHWNPTYVL